MTSTYSTHSQNPFWYSELVEEKVPANVNNISPDSLWGADFTKPIESKYDSQGNMWRADCVTKHPDILDPFMVHAPMPAPTMPDFVKFQQPSTTPSSLPIESFDPFSPRPVPMIKHSPVISKALRDFERAEPERERHHEREYEPDPVPLKKQDRIHRSVYDNTYHGSNKDDLPIMYPVRTSNKHKRGVTLYQEGFPVILDGIIDREDYINVVKGVNAAIIGALKKKRYSNGVSDVLTITGIILVVPLIPAMMLEDKKAKKVRKAKEMYLDGVNPQFERRGLKWCLHVDTQLLGMVPRLHLSIVNPSLIVPEMRPHFMRLKPANSWD